MTDIAIHKNPPLPLRKAWNAFEKNFVRHATAISIAAITIFVALILYEFHQAETASALSNDWVTHTYQVRGDLYGFLSHLDEAVIGERGYLIAGNENYLEAYNQAIKDTAADSERPTLKQELNNLTAMTADNPVQQKNLQEINATVVSLIDHLNAMIALRKTEGPTALAKIDPYDIEKLIARFHELLNAMVSEETSLLQKREQAERVTTRWNYFFMLYGMVAFYAIVILAIRFCQKAERRAQAQSAADAERYSLAIQGLSVGLWDWDITTNKPYYSEHFSQMLGLTSNAFSPDPVWFAARLHPEDRDRTMDLLNKHLRREGPYDVEYRLRHENGSYVWIHARGQALWGKSGKAVRMVGSAENITARKEAEQEIQRHIELLKRSNQELDDFAYIASHDLKEPLRGLVNNAMFLKEDYGDKLDETANKHLDRMAFLCQRMEKLMDDLLYFSRLGRQELAIQPADLNEVIKDIRLMMETTLQEEHATIDIPQPLPTVVCDLPRITEVFRNLITNAVKYNKSEEKRIEVGCADLAKRAGGAVKLGRKAFQAYQRRTHVVRGDVGEGFKFFVDVFEFFRLAFDFILMFLKRALQGDVVDGGRDGKVQQLGRDRRFHQIILCALLHRLHGDGLAALPGEHDHGQKGIGFAQAFQDFDAV